MHVSIHMHSCTLKIISTCKRSSCFVRQCTPYPWKSLSKPGFCLPGILEEEFQIPEKVWCHHLEALNSESDGVRYYFSSLNSFKKLIWHFYCVSCVGRYFNKHKRETEWQVRRFVVLTFGYICTWDVGHACTWKPKSLVIKSFMAVTVLRKNCTCFGKIKLCLPHGISVWWAILLPRFTGRTHGN